MKAKSFILLTLIVCLTSFAQENKTMISGSLDNNFSAILKDTVLFTDVETFRFGVKRDFGDRAGMETELIYTTGFSNPDPTSMFKDSSYFTEFFAMNTDSLQDSLMMQMMMFMTGDSILDTIITHARDYMMLMMQQMDTSALPKLPGISDVYYSSFLAQDEFKVDRALIKLYTNKADFYVGKQQMGWGTGYAWNPTDIFNQKSPMDPNAAKLGALSMRSEIGLPSSGLLSLVMIPAHVLNRFSAGARLSYPLPWFDASLSAVRFNNSDREFMGLPIKFQLGADLSGEVTSKAIGVWAEGCLANPLYKTYTDFDSSYIQAVLGSNYTFENGLLVTAEYYYNGLGNDTKNYSLTNFLYMMSGDMSGYAQHYLFGGTNKKLLNDYLDLNLFTLINLVDYSFALIPSTAYSFTDDISLELGASIFVGDLDTEYGALYPTCFLKAAAYF